MYWCIRKPYTVVQCLFPCESWSKQYNGTFIFTNLGYLFRDSKMATNENLRKSKDF